MSIIVFWLEAQEEPPAGQEASLVPHARSFDGGALAEALAHCEALRRAGMRHVTISSELEASVTRPGVSDVAPGYDWKKRRS